jgi:uncharacterized protein (TIGR02117 family)
VCAPRRQGGALLRGLVLSLAIMSAFSTGCLAPVDDLYPPRADEPVRSVWIVNHGMHTGIIVARRDVSPSIWPEHEAVQGFEFLEVGWGDQEYYQAARKTWWMALRAAFASSGSVLHIVGFNEPVAAFFRGAELIELKVSRRGFDALTRFVHETYARSTSGQPIRLGAGYYPNSTFFLARRGYHILDNCNNWTARALRAAGCPITPVYSVTAGNVMYQTRQMRR